jgi:hypothetical protein
MRLFYLSPAAPDVLATASSCCEYLKDSRKQAVLNHGQSPFEHDKQLESQQLQAFTGLDNNEQALTAAADAGFIADRGRLRVQEQQADEGLTAVQAAGPCVVFVLLWSLAAGASFEDLAVQTWYIMLVTGPCICLEVC